MEDLDRALRNLEPKLQKKHIKKACRAAAKTVHAKIKTLTPVDSGAMRESFSVRTTSKKIKAETGHVKQGTNSKTGFTYKFAVKKVVAEEFGAKVEISRKSLAKQSTKLVKKGKRHVAYRDNDKYFYPAFVELGGRGEAGQKPMRTALKQAEAEAMGIFASEMRKFVAETKPTQAITP